MVEESKNKRRAKVGKDRPNSQDFQTLSPFIGLLTQRMEFKEDKVAIQINLVPDVQMHQKQSTKTNYFLDISSIESGCSARNSSFDSGSKSPYKVDLKYNSPIYSHPKILREQNILRKSQELAATLTFNKENSKIIRKRNFKQQKENAYN